MKLKNIVPAVVLILATSLGLAQEHRPRDRNARGPGRTDGPVINRWKIEAEKLAKRDVPAEEKATLEKYLNGVTNCEWQRFERKNVDDDSTKEICVGVVRCDHPDLSRIEFEGVLCDSTECKDVATCMQDYEIASFRKVIPATSGRADKIYSPKESKGKQ